MSVTWFHASEQPVYLPHAHDDYCDPGCEGDYRFGVNFSNHNHRAVMYALQLDPKDYVGELDPKDLRARIALALAIKPDLSEPTVEVRGTGATEVFVGRTQQMILDRIERLLAVADAADERGERVYFS